MKMLSNRRMANCDSHMMNCLLHCYLRELCVLSWMNDKNKLQKTVISITTFI